MRFLFLFLLPLLLHAQIHINAGGPAYTDALGQAWQADTYYKGGAVAAGAGQLYASKRYGDFAYVLPVPDGSYTVALSFLENVVGPGERVFSVLLNGALVLSNYDVAAVDGLAPVRKLFATAASNGAGIRISFVTLKRSAFVNGIEVTPAAIPPAYLSGLASALPATCPAGPLGLYQATDTGDLWWCTAPGPWAKLANTGVTAAGAAPVVVGFTATQAILSYTAPDAATACQIEASESPAYAPLVHDVDPVLFPGSNLDPVQDGGLPGGTGRIVVLGKRRTDTAADGLNYSRALQANTRHYVRITCGVQPVQTTTFTTSSILIGTTFNDGPQVDPDHPGQWKMPARTEDRQQTIVDPQTGALLHAVSIAEEGGRPTFNGIFLGYGGFTRQCASKLVGPAGGPLGFVCTFLRYGQGGGVAYWIVPATGEVRLLGSVPITGGGALGSIGSDLRTYGPDNSGNTIWENYLGNFAPSKELPVSGWNSYSSVPANQMVHDFDAGFPLSGGFDCGRPWAAAGEYVVVVCGTGQDLPGWLAVLYGGDGRAIAPGCTDGNTCPRIVAAADIFHIASTLNCTLHNVQQMDDVVSINVQTLPNAPRCAAMGNMVYWRFQTDAHGQALVIDQFFDGGGHWDHGPLGRVTETGSGWGAVVGAPPADHLNVPYTVQVQDSPFFAGARGLSWGSTTSKHPSYHQMAGVAPAGELGWLLDMLPFDGGQFYSPASGATPVSGQLYRYNLATEQASTAVLSRKQVPTLAASGGRALIDISGPGSAIGDTAADSFRYCVVLLPGECRTGSVAGDIFVNAPGVNTLQCAGSDGPVPDRPDLCIGNLGAYQQAMVQSDLTGTARPRVITYGLAGIRNSFFYSTAKALPDASWALFSWGVVKQGFGDLTNVWMAKLPPLVEDGVDRSTFVRMPVSLTAPAGTVSAAVEFGYLENGTPDQHYCTSRREACVATTVTDAVPFVYPSEGIAGVPCASSCTVTVPVVPGRVVYWQARYFDGGGKIVGSGKQQISAR